MTRLKNLIDVLIVSGNTQMRQSIKDNLNRDVFYPVNIAENAEQARRLLSRSSFGLAVIDTPLPFESGIELALDIAESSYCSVILAVNSERLDETRYRVEDSGVVTVAKPLQRDQFSSALHLCTATYSRLMLLEKENEKLRTKLEELRLVNRAKWALCENLGMDEPSAHRYIEKKAMDNRITRLSVAKQILKEYH
ncbi:MAG: ANTAR domain-containing protein [Ruminococcaceae bacterium]|nr:ANTAR domain-containing protein [Oscillospiraceae bacterium]